MSWLKERKSPFEVASLTMKQLLRYFVEELKMPPDSVKLMVDGMLRGIQVERIYETEKRPEDPA